MVKSCLKLAALAGIATSLAACAPAQEPSKAQSAYQQCSALHQRILFQRSTQSSNTTSAQRFSEAQQMNRQFHGMKCIQILSQKPSSSDTQKP